MSNQSLCVTSKSYEEGLINFAKRLVQIKSTSGKEEELAKYIEKEMIKLDYDEVFIDKIGNVVGRIGNTGKKIMFDSHMDTIEVCDPGKWKHPPLGGDIVDGRLYGVGSVDMKGPLASSVYAPVIARKLGYNKGKTIYITCTVNEEDCDGENLKSLFIERNLKPDFFITCEPSSNEIALGHTGKAQILIKTKGVSAAAARPQNGINAVYKMSDIIPRVEKLNKRLSASGSEHGTITLTNIFCESASYNAVPSECSIYLDRRLVYNETIENVKAEMDMLIADTDASWEVGTLYSKSWTGVDIEYKPIHEPWRIDEKHELTQASLKAYETVFGKKHGEFHKWVGGTNAVTPVSMGIPCIGFGPGEDYLSHVVNENCIVEEILMASRFYAVLINNL